MHYPRADVRHEGDDTQQDADDVDDVVAVPGHLARTAAVEAALLLGLERARKGLRDERALERRRRVRLARDASRDGEIVDQTQDEEARESATQIGDAFARKS